jgi:hypothetical protein
VARLTRLAVPAAAARSKQRASSQREVSSSKNPA